MQGTPCYDAEKSKSFTSSIEPFTLYWFDYSCETTDPEYNGSCSTGGNVCGARYPAASYINVTILHGSEGSGNGRFFLESGGEMEYSCYQCMYGEWVYKVVPTACETDLYYKSFGSCDDFCGQAFGGVGKMESYWGGKWLTTCNCYCEDKIRENENGSWECYTEEPIPDEPPDEDEKQVEEYKGPTKEDISDRFKDDKKWKDTDAPIFTDGKELKTREEKVKLVEDVFGIDLEGFDKNMGKGKKVYIIYNDSIDEYREEWLGITNKSLAAIYMAEVLGYTPEVVYPGNSDEAFDYMVDPKAGGIIYFAHQRYSSLEEIEPDDLSSQFKMATIRHYVALGYNGQEARRLAEEQGYESLGKNFFLSFSCHSADNLEMVERTVKEGGVYYGHEGLLYPTEGVDEYIRPYK